MYNINDLYKKAVYINNNEIEYEYYVVLDWWKDESGFTYVRIENTNTGATFDIDSSLMNYMEKVLTDE